MDIDRTDYTILRALENADKPLWKNKIHQHITENIKEFPLTDTVSVQTVGRHVDALRDNGCLKSVIIKPKDIKRDLIIAFKLTDEGQTVVEETRESLLKEMLWEHLFTQNGFTPDVPRKAIANMISNQLSLEEDIQETMYNRYDEEELLTGLFLHYAEKQASEVFDQDSAWKLQNFYPEQSPIQEYLSENLA